MNITSENQFRISRNQFLEEVLKLLTSTCELLRVEVFRSEENRRKVVERDVLLIFLATTLREVHTKFCNTVTFLFKKRLPT